MKTLKFFVFTLGVLLFSGQLGAQSAFPLNYFLKEKVRDTTIRNFVVKKIDGKATAEDIAALEEYLQTTKKSTTYSGKSKSEVGLGFGAEPHIVIHPTNPNILAVAYMSVVGWPVFISTDAGVTWTQSTFDSEAALDSVYPGDFVFGGGDPILAFGKDGTLHFTYIYLHGNGFDIIPDMLYVYSIDTGSTFILPPLNAHRVYGGRDFSLLDLLDRQWMEVDNSGGAYDGNLYLSAAYFGGDLDSTGGQLLLIKAPNASAFDTVNVVNVIPFGINGEYSQLVNLKVNQQNGSVHISCAYITNPAGGGFIYHTVSNNGGQTFSPPVQVANGGYLFPMLGGSNYVVHGRENAAPSMAVDGNNVYIVWTDLIGPTSTISKAYFSYSNNGGQSFSTPFEFGNALVDSIYVFHFYPTVAADSGLVSISWHTVDKISKVTNYYLAKSSDFGVSFDTVMLISTDSSSFVGSSFYGDYNSSVKRGCYTYSVWSDGRSGSPGVYVAKTQTCSSAIGISELSPVSEAFKVSPIWPNPASNIVNLKLTLHERETVSCEIYDLHGKLIERNFEKQFPIGESQIQLNVNQLTTGLYLIKIQGSNGLFATRILVKE